MTQRLDYQQQSPDFFRKLYDVSATEGKCSIEESTRHLVHLRASQLNGCSFCVDMHVKQATIHGERAIRLHHVAAWRESNLFEPRERAALAWTEALTRIAPEGVSGELYEHVSAHFSEKELSDLTFVVVTINAWNRVNVAFRNVPGSMDKAWGLDKAGLV